MMTELAIAIIAAIAGWIAAIAGWANYFLQRRKISQKDWLEWDKDFREYRRNHLKPFADIIRPAYQEYIKLQRNVPQIWEDAVHAAKWPKYLPLPGGEPLPVWHIKYRRSLDTQSLFLLNFTEAIYPPFNANDKRPLSERSILRAEEFDIFDTARGGIADYFELCGNLMTQSKQFVKFLERDEVMKNHYYMVKLSAYLDLSLVRTWGDTSQVGPGKTGLFMLGSRYDLLKEQA